MKTATAEIKNRDGIHCRPTAIIIKAARDYSGTISVSGSNGDAVLNSALALMMLSLGKGSQITIRVEGPEEEATLKKFVELFEREYNFPRNEERDDE